MDSEQLHGGITASHYYFYFFQSTGEWIIQRFSLIFSSSSLLDIYLCILSEMMLFKNAGLLLPLTSTHIQEDLVFLVHLNKIATFELHRQRVGVGEDNVRK